MTRRFLANLKPTDRGLRHRGDIMPPQTRSALMARIKGKNTGPELALGSALKRLGFRWESHPSDLPGRPDFVFRKWRLVVFVDGDFWHGWRFSVWRDKLTVKWDIKIALTRRRDARVHRTLRRAGWGVLRIWEHQLECDFEKCVQRVSALLKSSRRSRTWSAASEPGISRSNGNKNPGFIRRLRRK